ncbi:MAG: acyl-CoA synthetase [Neomegalonema sp.]|nr:acyl-CoA synthetase [Neomegalonema sp.]
MRDAVEARDGADMAENQDWRLATLADKKAIEKTPFGEMCPFSSVTQMVAASCETRGDAPAVSFQLKGGPSDRVFTLSYAELWRQVTAFANALHERGVKPGDTIALVLPNLPETVVALLAAQTLGVALPINPLLEAEAIGGILDESGATAVVTLRSFMKTDVPQKVAEALESAPKVREVVQIDLLPYLPALLKPIAAVLRPKSPFPSALHVGDMRKLIKSAPSDKLRFVRDCGPDDIGAYYHTGGTTGSPKLAMHTHRSMLANAWTISRLILTEKDVALVALPIFHVFASYVLTLAPLAAGGHIVLVSPQGFRGDGVMDNFWKLIERHRATFLAAVPTALAALDLRPVNADVSSLRYMISGSAPLPTALFRRFESNTGVRILEGYGMTEATCVSSCNPPDGERKIGSVGYPIPWMDVAICAFDGNGQFSRACADGEIGEICFSGASVFGGYKDPARTAAVFFDRPDAPGRWLRTGDLGRIDSDGYIWITGRAKDLIIRGGHNIDPGLIEEALAEHPAVAFVGAIGQPDAYSGEMPCAYVELKPGAKVTEQELLDFATEHVHERAARPATIQVMAELPKTAVGKTFKPALRKEAIARVFGEALAKAGLEASVSVVDDPELGMCAEVTPTGAFDDAKAKEALDGFARPWRLVS